MTILGGNHQLISDAGDVGYPAWYRNLRDKSINQLLNAFPPLYLTSKAWENTSGGTFSLKYNSALSLLRAELVGSS